jgi:hypothetical protein
LGDVKADGPVSPVSTPFIIKLDSGNEFRIIGGSDEIHEIQNARRFGEISNGGTFDFDGVKLNAQHTGVEGVDGLYTFTNGSQTAVSLKSFSNSYMSGVLRTISDNVEHIAKTPYSGNTTIFADVFSRNVKQKINVNKVESFITRDPSTGLMNISTEGVVNRIVIDAVDGHVIIDPALTNGYKVVRKY